MTSFSCGPNGDADSVGSNSNSAAAATAAVGGSTSSGGGKSLFVGSFNINSEDLTGEAARTWLKQAADADIVALGLQVRSRPHRFVLFLVSLHVSFRGGFCCFSQSLVCCAYRVRFVRADVLALELDLRWCSQVVAAMVWCAALPLRGGICLFLDVFICCCSF